MFTAVAKHTFTRTINRELARATDALAEARKDREYVNELVAQRDDLVRRMNDAYKATARS